jgi:hypothetical protein
MSDPQSPTPPLLPQMPARHKVTSDDGPRQAAHGKLVGPATARTTEPEHHRMETEP